MQVHENQLLSGLKERGVETINTIEHVRRVASLIRRGVFSAQDLSDSKFSPYFPDSIYNDDRLNHFSSTGIADAKSLFLDNLMKFQLNGLIHAYVVGSAAVGLSHEGAHGVIKKRVGNRGFFYRRGPISRGDIDVNVFVSGENYDSFAAILKDTAEKYRHNGKFKSPDGSISFYLISFQDERDIVSSSNLTYSFVTHVLWRQTNFDLFEDTMGAHNELYELAMSRINNDFESREFFFQNAADRWAHGRFKMLIKQGYYRWIYEPSKYTPTLFSSAKRIKAKREGGYFQI